MTEQVELAPDRSCIRVVSSGMPSLSEMRRTIEAIAALRRAHGLSRVLVDSRSRSGQPAVADLFQGGELLARELGPGTRIAILVAGREPGHEFFENVAINRGASLAFFVDEREAVNWLTATPVAPSTLRGTGDE